MALCLLAGRLHAQGVLTLLEGQGQLGVAAEGTWHRVGGASQSAAGDYREWVRLPFAGQLASPRLFSWTATLQPTLQQRSERGFDRTLSARQLDVTAVGRVLADRPVHLTTTLSRSTASASGGYGSDRELVMRSLGGDLGWRNPWLPMHLSATTRHTEESWRTTPSAPVFRTDQQARTLRFGASNSKLSLDASRLAYEDRVSGTSLDATTLLARHQVRWGKGSRLQSQYEFQRETGLYHTRRTTWGEQLRLQHTRSLGTSWFYRRSITRVNATRSVGEAYGGGGDYRATRWLSLGVDGARFHGEIGPSDEWLTTLTPRAAVTLPLAPRARISASASASHENRRRQGPSPGSGLAIDEPHTVPLTRRFTLSQPDVVPASLAISDPGRTVVYVEGVDYSVVTVGRLTSVDIPVGGQLQPGDGLLVTYRYLLAAVDARGEAWRVEYGGTLQFRALALQHQRSMRSEGTTRGTPGLLAPGNDFDESRTSLTLGASTRAGRLDLEAALRQNDRLTVSTTEQTLTAGYAPPAGRRTQVSVAAGWSRLESGPEVARSLSGLASMVLLPADAFRLQVTAEVFRWQQTGQPDQHFLTGSLAGEYALGQLDLSLRAETHRRDFLITTHTRRVSLRVTRRF